LFDVKAKSYQHKADDDEADAQADAAVVAFYHGVFACFAICHCDLHARLDILLNKISLEAVNCDARLGERIARLILIESCFAHFHTSGFGETERSVCLGDCGIEPVEIRENGGAGAIAVVPWSMTMHADSALAGAEHCIGRLVYAVVGVAHDAAGQALVLKYLAMRAFGVHLRLEDVVVGAYVLYLVHAGRCGAVITVAGCAGGRAQVAAHRECIVMDAGGVVGELIGGDAVLLHIRGIRVTARTGLSNIDGIDRGTRVAGRTDVMNAVAIDANGYLDVSGSEALAVNACVVLVELICAQAWVVSAHEVGVGVARAAQCRNRLSVELALPPSLAAHGLRRIVTGRVAAVAADAGKALLGMDVLAELFLRDAKIAFHA